MPIRTALEIPKHIARSKALTTIYGVLGGYDPSQGTPDFTNSPLTYIGNVTSIEIPANRGSVERRELNAANLGRIVEIVPGLVDFEGVQLNHIVTYAATFLEASGFVGHVSDFQAYPMLYLLRLPSPNPAEYPERNLILEDVWIKNNPLMFSVEDKDDLRITQQVTLAVGNVREIII